MAKEAKTKKAQDKINAPAQAQRKYLNQSNNVPRELPKSTIDLVIENNIALQKIVTDLASEMKKISKEVSEMLDLFKEAAKSISSEKTESEINKSDIDELNAKINELVEQNKIIAKGILLLESSISPKEKYPSGY